MTAETLPAVVPAEPTTPIRPSEALRLGRLRYPVQLWGQLFGRDNRSACALGAMGVGGFAWNEPQSMPAADTAPCPVGGPFCAVPDERRVVHLNDRHHWSDDQIVAWLESLGL